MTLPIGFHKASAAAVLAIELAVPLLMIRRRLRLAAAALIVALQAAIALTGNYGYGPFAVIATTRSEIMVEASNDGEVWAPYEFRFKPGDPRRPLPWVAPHQPRLDWEMWFEALDHYRSDSWFERVLERLLAASPQVPRLVASAPFDGQPPRFVGAVLYRYRFAPSAVRRQQGLWWVRDRIGPYSPVLSLPDASPP